MAASLKPVCITTLLDKTIKTTHSHSVMEGLPH